MLSGVLVIAHRDQRASTADAGAVEGGVLLQPRAMLLPEPAQGHVLTVQMDIE